MASFISALPIFVLALVSVCFALPIGENPLFDTSSPFASDVTTDKLFNERMVFADANMFSTFSSTEQMMSEDPAREPRMLNDMVTSESFTFMPTTERSFHHKQREIEDSSVATMEPMADRVDFTSQDFRMAFHNYTGTEPSRVKRAFDDSVFATSESTSEMRSLEQQMTTKESSTSDMEMPMDFTTVSMPSFTSTSSAAAPELYTRDPAPTRKYTGLLADQEDREVDKEKKVQESKKYYGKHEKGELEMNEHKKHHDKHESEEHKHESEEHKHEEENEKKVDEPKKYYGTHKMDELEMKEYKKHDGKHGKDETDLEEHKPEGEKETEEVRQPEKQEEDKFEKVVEVAEPKDLIKTRPTTYRKVKVDSDDDIQYPKAVYDQDAWKNVPTIASDFAILDETSDVVTAISKVDSSKPIESHTEESKLDQGEESSRAE